MDFLFYLPICAGGLIGQDQSNSSPFPPVLCLPNVSERLSCTSGLCLCQCLWKDNLSRKNLRIIKSINNANLSAVSVQGDLLTAAAIACFNRLKAKCSYCICQTRQEKPCSFSVGRVEVSVGAHSVFLLCPKSERLCGITGKQKP